MYYQDIISNLLQFWQSKGCLVLQPYDMRVGAGTSHPATVLSCLTKNPWNITYIQPTRRPTDGRYTDNPNRVQHFYQLQVILKPSPSDIQDLCVESLKHLNLDLALHDLRFVEDNWKNPTLGAWGLGWEVWVDGMELLQFTYMQQIGGIDCRPVPCEITYGLERLAMYLQNVDSLWNIQWNATTTYRDIFADYERDHCHFNFSHANIERLTSHFHHALSDAQELLNSDIIIPAYEYCLEASHAFNLLEARGAIGVTERASYIAQISKIANQCCLKWVRRQ